MLSRWEPRLRNGERLADGPAMPGLIANPGEIVDMIFISAVVIFSINSQISHAKRSELTLYILPQARIDLEGWNMSDTVN